MAHHLAMTSAATIAGCGLYGYIKAKSRASLIGGAAISAAFAASSLAIQKTDHLAAAFAAAAATGAACAAVGYKRLTKVRIQQQQQH